jgi:hypothetical protein
MWLPYKKWMCGVVLSIGGEGEGLGHGGHKP